MQKTENIRKELEQQEEALQQGRDRVNKIFKDGSFDELIRPLHERTNLWSKVAELRNAYVNAGGPDYWSERDVTSISPSGYRTANDTYKIVIKNARYFAGEKTVSIDAFIIGHKFIGDYLLQLEPAEIGLCVANENQLSKIEILFDAYIRFPMVNEKTYDLSGLFERRLILVELAKEIE